MEEALRDPRRVRGHRLRNRPRPRPGHCRYKGLAKTHVRHVLTAAGADIVRLFAYDPPDEHPRPPRRISHLQRLCQQLAA